ncbi:methyltransferase [Streptomyces sp. NBC_00390]|uniref:HemK2/MTQ2 family protein methyltransferase n=1 Tax=Streptomyces sp. NBC_00390 TaxID=2975736 RepID=UPI002E24BCDC
MTYTSQALRAPWQVGQAYEVYTPQADTHLLAEALEDAAPCTGRDVLDLCTGTGVLALAAARRGARVSAVDSSPEAVATARANSGLDGPPVQVLRGDLFTPVKDRRFDLIVSNPPYVPAPDRRPPDRGRAQAWDAGPDGRAVLDPICAQAPHMLRPGGALLIVQSALCGTARTLTQLRCRGLDAAIVRRRQVPFGPVLRSRAGWLETRGLISPGESMEELVIIRAERTR